MRKRHGGLTRAASMGALAACVVAGLPGAAGAAAAPESSPTETSPTETRPTDETQVQAPLPTLTWRACTDIKGALCTTARVPLDYDKPNGPTILLDLAKVPARKQSAKIGTLFVNPGGPGGSSSAWAPIAAEVLGGSVRERYDVIGIDPRGVGKHSRIVCESSAPVPPEAPPFPITWTEAKQTWRVAQWIRTACQKDPGRIVEHMSTADTARDMDLIRQTVGDARLNYFGFSYGTMLGATYASMFRSKVGRMTIDGVLDPIAWATGESQPATSPFTTRLRSAKGAYEALATGMRECDRVGAPECAFAGNAFGKWRTLASQARAGTLVVDGQRIPYQELIGGVLGYLYMENYDELAFTLQYVWEHRGPGSGRAPEVLAGLREKAAQAARAPFMVDDPAIEVPVGALQGVGCADSRNPQDRIDWWRAGQHQDSQYPWFGSVWTWQSASCGRWPISTKADSYFGPFGGNTSNPILVVSSSYDPATPIHGARRVASLFDTSRLLVYKGWGHGALGASTCAGRIYDRFYATGTLPAAGTVCQPDAGLYANG